MSTDRLVGLDVDNLLESLITSSKASLEFVEGHWDDVLHAAFVYQVQPFLVFAQPRTGGKTRVEPVEMLHRLKRVCGRECITIGGLATDRDSGYDSLHENQFRLNLDVFVKNPLEMSHKRDYPLISDVLYLSKCAHDRILKTLATAIGLDVTSPELNLVRLIDIFDEDLPSMVFGDDAITKMHDSLPMVLFRFEILLKIYEARELG